MQTLVNRIIFFILGVIGGMPLVLTASTLSLRLIDMGINKSSIGLFGSIGVLYSVKFLYAPLIDCVKIPVLHRFFERYVCWMFLAIFAMFVGCLMSSIVDGRHDLIIFILGSLLITFASTIYDIAVDGFRIEKNKPSDLGLISAIYVYGYRLGMLISGGFTLYLAHYFEWQITYIIVGLLFVIFFGIAVFLGFCSKLIAVNFSHKHAGILTKKSGFKEIFLDPFLDILSMKYAKTFLLMVAIFKITDAYVGGMMNPFFVELGFSKLEIAKIVKGFGLIATLISLGIGGYCISKFSIAKMVIASMILQIIGNQMGIVQNFAGHNINVLMLTIFVENLCSGISTITLVCLISKACNVKFSGTQYALMTSFASFSRTVIGSSSGFVASHLGWNWFFIFAGALEIPCILLAYFLIKKGAIK